MKFNRIAGYLSEPVISRQLIICRALLLLGRNKEAQRRLMDLFERLKPNGDANSAAFRRRNRILSDAAEWLADRFAAESQSDRGVAYFQRMLKINPGWGVLYGGLCRLTFPGDDHIQLLRALHENVRPKFYIEIGVSKGVSISTVMPTTEAVGVDPAPQIAHSLPSNISIYTETSDAFFDAYEQRPQFGKRKIDMAFVDGLHLFEQALRDFINVEKRATANGLIAIHDCIPFDAFASARDYNAPYWVGDVWKCLAVLMDHRPDLKIEIVGAPPSGLVLISGIDPGSRLLEDKFDSLVGDYAPLRFADWETKYATRIKLVPSRAETIGRSYAGKQLRDHDVVSDVQAAPTSLIS
jgi:predicted O-methyltransferase YrrM